MTRPILYSFRRCPYAMRARLAIASAGITCELREILLRDKAPEFLATSPKGTVPVIVDGDTVIEESFDIMLWALRQNDPENWLAGSDLDLIEECDGPFKTALDRYKYHTRYDAVDAAEEREKAALFLRKIDNHLTETAWLHGPKPTLTDMAIITFVRQFAHVDYDWFLSQPWPNLIRWLEAFKASDRFKSIMAKYPKWQAGDPITPFPTP
ncbi:glutathione S-transferase [Aliiroseovarius sp. YM-037]|uniref:glutathione S-transferase n=1 Tax=Aliiroseovarius sp. YM-037 TaxID=3341728 RepID=UPI003A7FB1A3